MRGKAWTLAGAITLAALISSGTGLNAASKKGAIPDTNWSHAGGDSSEAHYSALTQINSVNGTAARDEPVMKPILANSRPAIVIVPGKDMSRPRCWMTMVIPTAVIARIAAKGSSELIAAG